MDRLTSFVSEFARNANSKGRLKWKLQVNIISFLCHVYIGCIFRPRKRVLYVTQHKNQMGHDEKWLVCECMKHLGTEKLGSRILMSNFRFRFYHSSFHCVDKKGSMEGYGVVDNGKVRAMAWNGSVPRGAHQRELHFRIMMFILLFICLKCFALFFRFVFAIGGARWENILRVTIKL